MYTVYMHICPNNKRYIGITGQVVEKRWNHGEGYSHQRLFYRAILKYGWDNIQHLIIKDNITNNPSINWRLPIATYKNIPILVEYNVIKRNNVPVTSEWKKCIMFTPFNYNWPNRFAEYENQINTNVFLHLSSSLFCSALYILSKEEQCIIGKGAAHPILFPVPSAQYGQLAQSGVK